MSNKRIDSEKIIQDISLLYELSLSIGVSINFKDNCNNFLKTLMLRKNLGFVSVWIRDEFLSDIRNTGWVSMKYAHPEFRVKDTHLPFNHPQFNSLRSNEVVDVSFPEPLFHEVITEKGIDKGVFTIFPLNRIGILKLYSRTRETPLGQREKNQLRSVISKFAVSLSGSLSHEMLRREISERKRAEDASQESEKRYRTLFDSAKDAIFIMKDYRIIDCNPMTLKMFGCTRKQIIGRSPYRFSPKLQPDGINSRKLGAKKASAALKGSPQLFEWLHTKWDRTAFHTEVALNRLIISGEEYLQSVVRDITDRRRSEEERREFEIKVQHAQKLESLGLLAGGIAHDFNNLLVGILGNADLALKDLSPTSPTHASIVEIETAAMRAADLSRQMLAYSGKGRFIIESVDLNEVVEEMGYLLKASISKKAILKYNFAENLQAIEADTTQIRQIIMNLITNASEAIGDKDGVITVTTGLMECNGSKLCNDFVIQDNLKGSYVCLEVADTGCGMTRETIGKIFDPFFTTKFLGRGLGLAAVLGIVRGHKGSISVNSRSGKGSIFKILLPAAGVSTDSKVEIVPGTTKWRGEGTILLVDDDVTVLSVGKRMLAVMGFSVLTASGGQDAVDLLEEKGDKIACVILDLTMPIMDGAETFSELRRINESIPVIISSGYSEMDVKTRFSNRKLAGFLHKPYRMSEIIDTMKGVLGKKKDPVN